MHACITAQINQQALGTMARVVKPIGEVDYLINMHVRQNKRQIFHVNILRQFHSSAIVNSGG